MLRPSFIASAISTTTLAARPPFDLQASVAQIMDEISQNDSNTYSKISINQIMPPPPKESSKSLIFGREDDTVDTSRKNLVAFQQAADFIHKDRINFSINPSKPTLPQLMTNPTGMALLIASGIGITLPAISLSHYSKGKINSLYKDHSFRQYNQKRVQDRIHTQTALANLLSIMSERMPQGGIGGRSIKQIHDERDSYRTSNQDWRNQMANASLQTIQRETLFVLSDILKRLQEMHETDTMMLQSMSMMQAKLAQLDNEEMSKLRSNIMRTLAR